MCIQDSEFNFLGSRAAKGRRERRERIGEKEGEKEGGKDEGYSSILDFLFSGISFDLLNISH